MADYKQGGNRYTAIFVIESERGGKKTYRRNPFDLVRFNVDSDPDAPRRSSLSVRSPAMRLASPNRTSSTRTSGS